MEVIIDTLADTGLGAIIFGIFIIGAILIEFFGNKPKT